MLTFYGTIGMISEGVTLSGGVCSFQEVHMQYDPPTEPKPEPTPEPDDGGNGEPEGGEG